MSRYKWYSRYSAGMKSNTNEAKPTDTSSQNKIDLSRNLTFRPGWLMKTVKSSRKLLWGKMDDKKFSFFSE